jgi:hypothetical protein
MQDPPGKVNKENPEEAIVHWYDVAVVEAGATKERRTDSPGSPATLKVGLMHKYEATIKHKPQFEG